MRTAGCSCHKPLRRSLLPNKAPGFRSSSEEMLVHRPAACGGAGFCPGSSDLLSLWFSSWNRRSNTKQCERPELSGGSNYRCSPEAQLRNHLSEDEGNVELYHTLCKRTGALQRCPCLSSGTIPLHHTHRCLHSSWRRIDQLSWSLRSSEPSAFL